MDSFDTMQFSTWRTMSRHYDSIADRAYRLIVYARMGGVEAGARDRWVGFANSVTGRAFAELTLCRVNSGFAGASLA